VKAAVEAHRLTVAVGDELRMARDAGTLKHFPSTLTFQSAVDFTVSSRAVVRDFYERLPAAPATASSAAPAASAAVSAAGQRVTAAGRAAVSGTQ